MRAKRRAEARSGPRGERLAAEFLRGLGCTVVAHNLRTIHGEIDLLVRDGRELVAVEVKARRDHPAPEATVRPEQLDRIGRSLHAVARSIRPRPAALRIDIVAVRWSDPEPEVRRFPSVRRWRFARYPCGSASVPDWAPADTSHHACPPVPGRLSLRALHRGFLAFVNWLSVRLRPRDADSR